MKEEIARAAAEEAAKVAAELLRAEKVGIAEAAAEAAAIAAACETAKVVPIAIEGAVRKAMKESNGHKE